ncbi:MAG: peptidylprolyl isomerase [Treponema sp.]|nr:peptidylprolyl isomerase [Treponema sp.]
MVITKNKVVSLDYTLKDMNDEVIDMSGPEPLVYLHGHGNIISGLEKTLEGKTAGESFKVTIPAADAYGEREENAVITLPRSSFGGINNLSEGMELEAQFPEGSQIIRVIKITETEVTVDGNHPMAGMDLNFDVIIREVRDATEEEITHGHIHHSHENCCDCGADNGCKTDDDCKDGCCG